MVFANEANMKTAFDRKKALAVIAQYGFRKTSVGDVATAVELSRQSKPRTMRSSSTHSPKASP